MFKFSELSVLNVVSSGKLPGILDTMLRQAGVTDIHAVEKSDQVFDAIKERGIDIVLVDDNPPKVDGVDLVAAIRLDPDSPNCYLPVILLSRTRSIKRAAEAVESGVHAVMLQPFPAPRLLSHITKCIIDPPKFICSDRYFGPDQKSMDAVPAEARKPIYQEQEGLQAQVDRINMPEQRVVHH